MEKLGDVGLFWFWFIEGVGVNYQICISEREWKSHNEHTEQLQSPK